MTHSISPQVRLANEIAVQFHHQPATEAATAIANHIRLFWDPRMKAELMRRVETDAASLDPLVIAAAERLRNSVREAPHAERSEAAGADKR